MRVVSIGSMDRRITIQKLFQGVGSTYGEPTETWVDWSTCWAAVEELTGRELAEARQISAEITTKFTIRWVDRLSPTMRIVYSGQTFDIHHIAELGRKEYWAVYGKARRSP